MEIKREYQCPVCGVFVFPKPSSGLFGKDGWVYPCPRCLAKKLEELGVPMLIPMWIEEPKP